MFRLFPSEGELTGSDQFTSVYTKPVCFERDGLWFTAAAAAAAAATKTTTTVTTLTTT